MKPSRLALLAVLAAAVASCEAPADTLDYTRRDVLVWKAKELKAPADANPKRLKVMAWNVKYGAGRVDFWFDFWGDRVQLSVDEVNGNMEAIYKLINEYDPDVMMAEEIEVNSRRSAYYDMVQGILDHTGLNYGAYFPVWVARYVPSEGVGRIDMGNALFSKFPIKKAEAIRQADRTDQDAATSYFYLHRALGRAVLDLGTTGEVAAYVIHTEAYDTDGTKAKHIKEAYDYVKAETIPFVIGGDFNELPPSALHLKGFPDEPASSIGTEFEQPPYTPALMSPFFNDFSPAITLDMIGDTADSQLKYYTHTVLGPETRNDDGLPGFWNRTLDYIFVKKDDGWVANSTDVLQSPGRLGITSDPMKLSDHAPIVGTWNLGSAQ